MFFISACRSWTKAKRWQFLQLIHLFKCLYLQSPPTSSRMPYPLKRLLKPIVFFFHRGLGSIRQLNRLIPSWSFCMLFIFFVWTKVIHIGITLRLDIFIKLFLSRGRQTAMLILCWIVSGFSVKKSARKDPSNDTTDEWTSSRTCHAGYHVTNLFLFLFPFLFFFYRHNLHQPTIASVTSSTSWGWAFGTYPSYARLDIQHQWIMVSNALLHRLHCTLFLILGQIKFLPNHLHNQVLASCSVEKAIQIQAWWRGVREAKHTKMEMRKAFEADVIGITGLRCLVLIGRDEEVLSRWSKAMLELGKGSFTISYIFHFTHAIFKLENIFAPALGDQSNSWLVLIRQACLFLLQSIADSPQCVLSYCIHDPSNTLFRSSNSLMHFQLSNISRPSRQCHRARWNKPVCCDHRISIQSSSISTSRIGYSTNGMLPSILVWPLISLAAISYSPGHLRPRLVFLIWCISLQSRCQLYHLIHLNTLATLPQSSPRSWPSLFPSIDSH